MPSRACLRRPPLVWFVLIASGSANWPLKQLSPAPEKLFSSDPNAPGPAVPPARPAIEPTWRSTPDAQRPRVGIRLAP